MTAFTETLPEYAYDKPALLAALAEVLPDHALLLSTEQKRPYDCDGLSAYHALPVAVLLPETVDQVQRIMTVCHAFGAPVVARGAGTGLSGGALPCTQGVLLSLAKFNRIVAIDPAARTARVQSGVSNLRISQAAAPYGLYYAPDPSSQIACTLGGNVAENAGGVHCLKYGLTVHNVLEVQVITVDGERLTLGGPAPDSPGYDLLALIHGSEGMLGIIVELTVKLLPKPQVAKALLAAFDDVAKAGEAVGAVIADGIIPAGLEMMDALAIQAAEAFVQAGYPLDAEAILICELDGTLADVAHQAERVTAILQNHGATAVRIPADEAQRLAFWSGRKNAFPAVGRISPDYYCMDGTIPRKALPEVLTRIAALSREHGLRCANVFHAGDGNLHPLILYDANAGELAAAERFGAAILRLCVDMGGAITGEHGVGMEKINDMCVQFNAAELRQLHAVKAAFDPHGLLNPGKAVPTLHRCAEFGAMHVHHGRLPHPDLPRF